MLGALGHMLETVGSLFASQKTTCFILRRSGMAWPMTGLIAWVWKHNPWSGNCSLDWNPEAVNGSSDEGRN